MAESDKAIMDKALKVSQIWANQTPNNCSVFKQFGFQTLTVQNKNLMINLTQLSSWKGKKWIIKHLKRWSNKTLKHLKYLNKWQLCPKTWKLKLKVEQTTLCHTYCLKPYNQAKLNVWKREISFSERECCKVTCGIKPIVTNKLPTRGLGKTKHCLGAWYI